MKVIDKHHVVFVDVDGTLVERFSNKFWRSSEEQEETRKKIITIACSDFSQECIPNKTLIDCIRREWQRGLSVIVWSQRGYDWAEAVVKALELNDIVEAVMSKPLRYYDDIDAKDFMGSRIEIYD